MRERGDLDCAHEPFMYDYYVHRLLRKMPHFDADPTHPKDYRSIPDMLMKRAETAPVFFKDMSYYVMPHLLEARELCDRIIHMFQIRDPAASILSYTKLDLEVTSQEIGLKAQWLHVEGLLAQGRSVHVIRAEDVRGDAETMMSKLWQQVGLPFLADAFNWSDAQVTDWQQVGGWHGDVSSAKGIKPLDDTKKLSKNKSLRLSHRKVHVWRSC